MNTIFSFVCISLFCFSANAGIFQGEYRLGLYKDSVLNPQKITHVIVVGTAVKKDSDGIFQSGIARATKYKEVWPDHQVVIMSSPEVRGKNDEEVFNNFKIPVIKILNNTFTTEVLLSELFQFSKIASLDFYGHSSPWAFKLGKNNAVFDPSANQNALKNLRSHFLPNAFITINSCNSGFNIAPSLSRGLELPVAGALTSSVLERIESDGKWYKESDWTPENYVTTNDYSFNENLSCELGLCWRMKPDHSNYSSYWGSFNEGGLSFYKFFCNYERTSNASCEKGMAMSLFGFPSTRPLSEKPTLLEFQDIAFDWLCSTHKNKNKFSACVIGIKEAINRGDLVYQTHSGVELNCNFKNCNATVVCKERVIGNGPKAGSCRLKLTSNEPPTNAAEEMLSLIKGFELLHN